MKEYLTIGEMAESSGFSAKTLRFYDEKGLLKPAAVDKFTSYRRYSANQLDKLRLIELLKGLGLTLDQIKAEFDQMDGERLYELLGQRLEKIDEELEHLLHMRGQIQDKRERLGTALATPPGTCFIETLKAVRGTYFPFDSDSSREQRVTDQIYLHKLKSTYGNEMQTDNAFRVIAKEDFLAGEYSRYKAILFREQDMPRGAPLDVIIPERTYAICYCPKPKEKSEPYWELLRSYVIENDLEVIDDPLRRIILGMGITASPEDYISMLAAPVRRRKAK